MWVIHLVFSLVFQKHLIIFSITLTVWFRSLALAVWIKVTLQAGFFRLYDKVNEIESAAAAFTEYCLREEDRDKVAEQTEFYNALQYLANYHLKKGELDDAYTYAYKCMECEEVTSHVS